jgi:hypothetical protein
MDDGFFDEFIQAAAFQVVTGPWALYDGLISALELADNIPSEPFRLAITVSPVAGHAVLEGSISLGDEVLQFTEAGKLNSTVDLSELPEVSVEGLDCNILIECEVLRPITVVVFPKTRVVPKPHGSSAYMETNYNVYTEAALHIGDQIRYTDQHQGTTIDIYVKDVSDAVDLEDNSHPFRVFYCA